MRQDSQLEALKQRIAESARKAGLDGEMGVEKNIKVWFFNFQIWNITFITRISASSSTSCRVVGCGFAAEQEL